MSDVEKAIRHFKNSKEKNLIVLNDFKKEIEMKKVIGNNNINYSSSIYENRDKYYLLAIQALEKQEYFRNCKDCNCIDSENTCLKFNISSINPQTDGCTFYED
ncbi:hypothetical protein J2Z76_000480 [Sedimentibacter acidaminivorans]|uniref:DUF5651 domain-containing protein n=1 Tax=Sedimentibacter acidaminivorans TaxID=913099 RepID=A0ABS4GAQ4_9FIRM|nr:hypothetical protein [Sedimentibacter acidaminivorans]MBP1924627.1 hypothetical protein [Sedimentibacter acidaminivorans]